MNSHSLYTCVLLPDYYLCQLSLRMEIHCFDTFNNPIVDSSINVKINSFERLGWMVVESFEIYKSGKFCH